MCLGENPFHKHINLLKHKIPLSCTRLPILSKEAALNAHSNGALWANKKGLTFLRQLNYTTLVVLLVNINLVVFRCEFDETLDQIGCHPGFPRKVMNPLQDRALCATARQLNIIMVFVENNVLPLNTELSGHLLLKLRIVFGNIRRCYQVISLTECFHF